MSEHTPAPTPARSLYGFFMYLISKTALLLYLIWVLVPEEWLHYLNIYYYPQKYWATAVPIQCLVGLTMFAFFVYPSINLMLTAKIDSQSTICDSYSQKIKVESTTYTSPNICICQDNKKCLKDNYLATSKELSENTVPQLYDIDIRLVCRNLYLNKRK